MKKLTSEELDLACMELTAAYQIAFVKLRKQMLEADVIKEDQAEVFKRGIDKLEQIYNATVLKLKKEALLKTLKVNK